MNEFKIDYLKPGETGKAKVAKLVRPQATFSQDALPIANVVDNNPATGWAIAPQFGKPQVAVFELQGKIGTMEGTTLTVTMVQKFGTDHTIGKFRISVTNTKPPVQLQGTVPENIAAHRRAKDQPHAGAASGRQLCARSIRAARLQRAVDMYPVPPV